MKFSVLATVPLLAFAAAAPALEERATDNYALILKSIQQLEKDITALDNLVVVNPPNFGAIQTQEQVVEKDLGYITNNATSSSVATSTESTNILNEINNNLRPVITKVLNDLVAKKANFASVKSLVKQDLTNLDSDTGAAGSALISKASGPAKTQAPAVVSSIRAQFTSAIAQYS